METTFYLIAAAVILGFIGYMIGIGKILLKPSVLLGMAVILLLPFALNFFIWYYASSTPETVIPDVMGMTSEKAIEQLQDSGLDGEVIGVSFSKEPSGTVISQRPAAGKRVKEGRTISLIVSAAETTVTVPDVVGKTSEEAASVLSSYGLTIGKVNYIYSDSGNGIITEQSPSSGNIAMKGSEISVTIMTRKEEND